MTKLLPYYFAITILITIGCNNERQEIQQLQTANDSLAIALAAFQKDTPKPIATFLTFQDGNAERAMNFYVDLFDNSKITGIQRWEKDAPVESGKIMHATFELGGNLFMCSDSPPIHDWDFSPAVSNFVECVDEIELQRLYDALSKDGAVTMPLGDYGFSQQFGWVIDQWGISWQLNLE